MGQRVNSHFLKSVPCISSTNPSMNKNMSILCFLLFFFALFYWPYVKNKKKYYSLLQGPQPHQGVFVCYHGLIMQGIRMHFHTHPALHWKSFDCRPSCRFLEITNPSYKFAARMLRSVASPARSTCLDTAWIQGKHRYDDRLMKRSRLFKFRFWITIIITST